MKGQIFKMTPNLNYLYLSNCNHFLTEANLSLIPHLKFLSLTQFDTSSFPPNLENGGDDGDDDFDNEDAQNRIIDDGLQQLPFLVTENLDDDDAPNRIFENERQALPLLFTENGDEIDEQNDIIENETQQLPLQRTIAPREEDDSGIPKNLLRILKELKFLTLEYERLFSPEELNMLPSLKILFSSDARTSSGVPWPEMQAKCPNFRIISNKM